MTPSRKTPKTKLATLQWLVENRSRNQMCAIRLFKLLKENQSRIEQKGYELFAQDLVGITFSLWRAVFLADKKWERAVSLESAIQFFETLIADNAINYPQDKKFNEWTFNYYTNNVRYAFLHLEEGWKKFVPKWHSKDRPPEERWEYGQNHLEQTIEKFAEDLSARL